MVTVEATHVARELLEGSGCEVEISKRASLATVGNGNSDALSLVLIRRTRLRQVTFTCEAGRGPTRGCDLLATDGVVVGVGAVVSTDGLNLRIIAKIRMMVAYG